MDKDVGGAAGTGDGDVLLKFLPRYAENAKHDGRFRGEGRGEEEL